MAAETAALWNKKYSAQEYVYGTTPNDFLVSAVAQLQELGKPSAIRVSGQERQWGIGKVFSVGEGEGRNACFLASLAGSEVHSIDASEVGVAKTLKLASERGVVIHASQGFLEDLNLAPNSIDTFVSIFCHSEPEVRSRVHRMAQDALRPGGVFILEAYTPRQVAFGTGGPKLEALLLTESQLKADLDGMEFVVLQEIERDVREGDHANNSQNNSHCNCNNDDNDGNDDDSGDDDEENRRILHTGHAAVIQCLGVKSG